MSSSVSCSSSSRQGNAKVSSGKVDEGWGEGERQNILSLLSPSASSLSEHDGLSAESTKIRNACIVHATWIAHRPHSRIIQWLVIVFATALFTLQRAFEFRRGMKFSLMQVFSGYSLTQQVVGSACLSIRDQHNCTKSQFLFWSLPFPPSSLSTSLPLVRVSR